MTEAEFSDFIKMIKFDRMGLVTVVVQDSNTAEVLMTAWANERALKMTFDTGELVLWSRSRGEIWHKGLTSGSRMKVSSIRADCDGDTLLVQVEPMGPACHTGSRTCFYREGFRADRATDGGTFLHRLYRYLERRVQDPPEESYTARLMADGRFRVAQTVGEEGVETALALVSGDKNSFRGEAADLVYHLLVACISAGVPLSEVIGELQSRHGENDAS
ncbi:MAG: bifunctional phosphoribosyl-AMP cyclohydrolase/phosphoribosyl-ATP diphosphatase HisIE [Synergistaceae bacterium]|jgi:phosphoribosyl-ATP pyrophosphohydrolase/phosphoribosyl-AMP cyclohydrolase|nr:bifunctional phosphoribosyl-AMP cyclohydrolase/phosphoribosyl-ATP diphosphatase HisIE [Synergistaceae bacterium]